MDQQDRHIVTVLTHNAWRSAGPFYYTLYRAGRKTAGTVAMSVFLLTYAWYLDRFFV